MDRRVALIVVGSAAVAILMVAVSSSGSVPLAERGPSMPFDLPEFGFGDITIETVPPEEDEVGGLPRDTQDVSADLRSYALNLLLLGMLALLVRGAYVAWQHRPELLWRPTPRRDDFAVLEAEVAAAMSADESEQRAALERGEARNAIVACWSRLENLTTDAGFERDPADTAAEFTTRVLGRFDIEPRAIERLSALYREARFSTHPMGEPERAIAIAALDEIHAGLRRSTPSTVTP
jgi:hypothetical protein